MILDLEKLEANKCYSIMSNSIFPRPIAWIVTENSGVINVAPFSYFAPLTSKPAVAVVSIGKKESGEPKDTLANILDTKKATICIPNSSHANFISKSATSLPKDSSEIEEFNIPTKRVNPDFPPIIKGVHAAYFATFRDSYEIEGSPTLPIFLNLLSVYFDDSIINENLKVDMKALGRVGAFFITEGERIKA